VAGNTMRFTIAISMTLLDAVVALRYGPEIWTEWSEVSAGINRHEAGNERFLRERSSEPLGPEFCAVPREAHGEA
jgi:hypothetical protein